MSTCNRLDLQTPGSQPVVMPKKLPNHWAGTSHLIRERDNNSPWFFLCSYKVEGPFYTREVSLKIGGFSLAKSLFRKLLHTKFHFTLVLAFIVRAWTFSILYGICINGMQCSRLKSSMPFNRDLALQNIISFSKQPFKTQPLLENEDITSRNPQYNLPATRTNKRTTLSLQEVELDGWFFMYSHCNLNMYHIIHAQV